VRRFAQDDGFVGGLKKEKHPFMCAENAKRLKKVTGSHDDDFCWGGDKKLASSRISISAKPAGLYGTQVLVNSHSGAFKPL
jgi:hypothetical protein